MKKIFLTIMLIIFTLTLSNLSNAQAPFDIPSGNAPSFLKLPFDAPPVDTPPFNSPPGNTPPFLTLPFNTPPVDAPPFDTPPAHIPSFLALSSNKPPLQMPANNPVFGTATAVAPEPISSILFLTGGATLIVRCFTKIKKGA